MLVRQAVVEGLQGRQQPLEPFGLGIGKAPGDANRLDSVGFAARLCLLFEGGSANDALRQLSWRYGHIKLARTGILDAFFLRYQREAEGRKPFLDWVRQDYDEVELKHDFHANGLASFINDWVLAHE